MKNLLIAATTSFRKLFLLAYVGTGAFVGEVKANDTNSTETVVISEQEVSAQVQAKIRAKVKTHQHEIANIKTSTQLNSFLQKIKKEIIDILNEAECLSAREKALKSALETLNPNDKFSIAANIHAILNNLDADISAIIKNAIPDIYKKILMI